jgi:hypothetical protein
MKRRPSAVSSSSAGSHRNPDDAQFLSRDNYRVFIIAPFFFAFRSTLTLDLCNLAFRPPENLGKVFIKIIAEKVVLNLTVSLCYAQ